VRLLKTFEILEISKVWSEGANLLDPLSAAGKSSVQMGYTQSA
jgi:hypothetical protein